MLKIDINFLENISKIIARKVLRKVKVDKLFVHQVFNKPSYIIGRWACETTRIESSNSNYYSEATKVVRE